MPVIEAFVYHLNVCAIAACGELLLQFCESKWQDGMKCSLSQENKYRSLARIHFCSEKLLPLELHNNHSLNLESLFYVTWFLDSC